MFNQSPATGLKVVIRARRDNGPESDIGASREPIMKGVFTYISMAWIAAK
jgi:hypothetical protein